MASNCDRIEKIIKKFCVKFKQIYQYNVFLTHRLIFWHFIKILLKSLNVSLKLLKISISLFALSVNLIKDFLNIHHILNISQELSEKFFQFLKTLQNFHPHVMRNFSNLSQSFDKVSLRFYVKFQHIFMSYFNSIDETA